MKLKISTFILLLFIGLIACNKPSEYFISKWQILNVVEKDESIALHENWIHFKSDGTFNSYDGDLKKNESGKWTYQSKVKSLFIDGEGEKGDSQWTLSMKKDTLIFKSPSNDLYLIAKKMQ